MAIDPERLAQCASQRASAIALQRSFRRWINRTYERDAAARVLQHFVRRHVLRPRQQGLQPHHHRHHHHRHPQRQQQRQRQLTELEAATPRRHRLSSSRRLPDNQRGHRGDVSASYHRGQGDCDGNDDEDDDDVGLYVLDALDDEAEEKREWRTRARSVERLRSRTMLVTTPRLTRPASRSVSFLPDDAASAAADDDHEDEDQDDERERKGPARVVPTATRRKQQQPHDDSRTTASTAPLTDSAGGTHWRGFDFDYTRSTVIDDLRSSRLPMQRERDDSDDLYGAGREHHQHEQDTDDDDDERQRQRQPSSRASHHQQQHQQHHHHHLHGRQRAETAPSRSGSRRLSQHSRRRVLVVPPEFEVFLWHGAQLGLEMGLCPITGFPFVETMDAANDALPGIWHVREGDVLVAINDTSAHDAELAFADVEVILESGVRPAILRFRRPTPEEERLRVAYEERRQQRQQQRGQRRQRDRHSRLSMSMAALTASSGRSFRDDVQRRRERAEPSLAYLIWREEDGPLGLRFVQEPSKPYPEVSEIRDHGVAARDGVSPRVGVGDLLLRINHRDVSSMGFKSVLQVLHYSPRPLVLTFRRARTPTIAGGRTYDL